MNRKHCYIFRPLSVAIFGEYRYLNTPHVNGKTYNDSRPFNYVCIVLYKIMLKLLLFYNINLYVKIITILDPTIVI
jgi:hypothetical protein